MATNVSHDSLQPDFDPYHKWLGIPCEEQPPTHYRLLGLQPFESDPDVVDAAAMRQSLHLKTYQLGEHAALSQKLLNEVAKAKICLLQPQQKADYDEQLRAINAARHAPSMHPSLAEIYAEIEQGLPSAAAKPNHAATASPGHGRPRVGARGPSQPSSVRAKASPGAREREPKEHAASVGKPKTGQRQANPLPRVLGTALSGLLGLAMACVIAWFVNRPPRDGTLFIKSDAPDAQVTVTRDGTAVTADARSGWTLSLKPGRYELAIHDSNDRFQLETKSVTIRSNEEVTAAVKAVPTAPPTRKLVVQQIADQAVMAGEPLTVTAAVKNPSSWPGVKYSFSSSPTLDAKIDANTGVFKWTPPATQAAGEYSVTVTVAAADGRSSPSTAFKITVTPPHMPHLRQIAAQTVEAGERLTVQVSLEDAARWEKKVQYSLPGSPPSGATIDPQSGEFSWMPSRYKLAENYDVTVAVRTPDDLGDQLKFTVNVTRSKSSIMLSGKVAKLPRKESLLLGLPERVNFNLGNGTVLGMVLIPAGKFGMGSPDADWDASADEKPQHEVRITEPFYLGKYQVTQGLWREVMGDNPAKSPANPVGMTTWSPVEKTTWEGCQTFLQRLNERLNRGRALFRLPTEAEWEYACRAGSTTKYWFGDDGKDLYKYGWFRQGNTHRVGQKQANAWGLYDMRGNAWEWCSDWFGERFYDESPMDDPRGPSHGTSHVLRGGGWSGKPPTLRSAQRTSIALSPDDNRGCGLRIVYIGTESAAKQYELDAAFAKAIGDAEWRVAAWDFQAALEKLNTVHFDAPELAERLKRWRSDVTRMAVLKDRMIAMINKDYPKPRKSELGLRGPGGEVTEADASGIRISLSGSQVDKYSWSKLPPGALKVLFQKVGNPDDAGDCRAADLLPHCGYNQFAAQEYFSSANQLGAETSPCWGPPPPAQALTGTWTTSFNRARFRIEDDGEILRISLIDKGDSDVEQFNAELDHYGGVDAISFKGKGAVKHLGDATAYPFELTATLDGGKLKVYYPAWPLGPGSTKSSEDTWVR